MNKSKGIPGRNGQDSNNIEINSAKLAILAGAVTTFGDILGTIADALALEEGLQAEAEQTEYQKMQDEKIASMQKQIDELTLQIKNLAKK
ncbi:hypothetical protein [Paenibacillus sp. YIM B09110]|uniref:hypothetical protein n=1 Tax=Paenibacillus sp. YIM B09110 TaxID=3126102 RepID=UPI00301BD9A7